MAPEQLQGMREVGPQVDVWALGCVLYEALALTAPFPQTTLPMLLTCILNKEPDPLRSLRPDVGEALADLIHRMLSKQPARRPADGSAVLRELSLIPVPVANRQVTRLLASGAAVKPAAEAGPPSQYPVLSTSEQRVQSLLLCKAEPDAEPIDAALYQEVEKRGGQLQAVEPGIYALPLRNYFPPLDEATRLARLALMLCPLLPRYSFSLVTRRILQLPGQSSGTGSGEFSRGPQPIAGAAPEEIRLDDATAALLDGRFEIHRAAGQAALLRGERQMEVQRTLLGQHIPLVGRQRELSILQRLLSECIAEERALAVVVTAPAGMGKSRLQAEFVRALKERGEEVEIWIGQGEAMAVGTPFLLTGSAVRRAAGVLDGHPIELRRRQLAAWVNLHVPAAEQERITAFLGEMIGVPFPDEINPALAAARREPMLMAEGIGGAFERFVQLQSEQRPLLVIFEDLHWGDLPSVKLIDRVLSRLPNNPLLILALARPEVHTVFPQLWSERSLMEIRLEGLGRKLSTQLLEQALGSDLSAEWVEKAIEHAGGNAFFLEELIRARATGVRGELPETVLGMIQARLYNLAAEARRVLQVASVFGESFGKNEVRALLGDQIGAFPLDDLLNHLCECEMLAEQSEGIRKEDTKYKYRHGLVRDAAYQMLTDADRALAHCMAGNFLEDLEEGDPLVLAEHFIRGKEQERAIKHYIHAAEQALEGNDLAAAMKCAARARQAGALGEQFGRVLALQATVTYWQSQHEESYQYAAEAIAHLQPGSAIWFQMVAQAAAVAPRLGKIDMLSHWHMLMLSVEPDPSAQVQRIICLSRCCLQWFLLAEFDRCEELMKRLTEQLGGREIENPLARAQYEHACASIAVVKGGMVAAHRHVEVVVESFEQAGDIRNSLVERASLAISYAEQGRLAAAEALARDNLKQCQRHQVAPAQNYTKLALSLTLSMMGPKHPEKLEEARRLGEEALAAYGTVGYRRWEGLAHTMLGFVEMAAADFQKAERHGEAAAQALAASPLYLCCALATRARALCQLGRAAEALACAQRAMELLRRCKHLEFGELQVPLALAEALAATGSPAEAAQCLADARLRVQELSQLIENPDWRQSYLHLPDIARILALTESPPREPPG